MTFKSRSLAGLVCLGMGFSCFAQRSVPRHALHERVLVVVPMVGAGTYADPRRPLFAPPPGQLRTAKGIHSFSYEVSDDGKFALVEFVALDRSALAPLLTDVRVLKAFEKGKHKKADIERELKIFKKDFRADTFAGSPVAVRP
jgi:hypothetical protein